MRVQPRHMVLFLLATVAGCHRSDGGSAPGGAPGAGGASANEITFKTADGWTIHADWSTPKGAAKAVILLHQRGGSASDWAPVVAKLNAAGIATLALDQRGAGRSQGPHNGDDAPWDTTPDIAGAVEWLKVKGIAANHVGLAGASYGANNALIYAAAHPQIPAVALLSPGANYQGLVIQPAAAKYHGAVLILTSSGDSITGEGPQIVERDSPGAKELKTYDGDAHGTAIFSAHADSIDAVTGFFKAKL